MKRVLLAAVLSVPLWVSMSVHAAEAALDPITQGNAEVGAAKAAACGACHGPVGNSANPEWPSLAGQSSRFIVEQLQQFKSGKRMNPLMNAQAAALTDQDMKDLGAYYAAQKAAPGVASEAAVTAVQGLYRGGDASRGLPACAACHGPVGAGVAAAAYPRISGQHSVYVANRLRAYRDAAKTTLPDGNFKSMATVAGKLTDQEIEALASYVNGLH